MASSCYILFSKNLGRFYIGATHESVWQRLDMHNQHSYGNHRHTAKADDWEVFITIEVNNYAHAVRMERKIKSMKSKNYILNLKQYPELRQKLISQTST
jgi:putative endonuclease